MNRHELPSTKIALIQELDPTDLGFNAVALSAGRKVGNVVRVGGFTAHHLVMKTTGGGGTGRSELEFTAYALNGTEIVARTVVLGGVADIFHTDGTSCALTWGLLGTASAFSPPTAASFTAGTLDLFRAVQDLRIELNPTTADATATVSMWLYSVK